MKDRAYLVPCALALSAGWLIGAMVFSLIQPNQPPQAYRRGNVLYLPPAEFESINAGLRGTHIYLEEIEEK